jgi:TRAP-type C4-dicarboxylate transport system permease small subunit
VQTLERIAAWIFGLAFLTLAAAVATETFSRKVLNKSLQGVDELGGYILAIGAALSFAVALAGRTHIRIDLLHDLLPRSLRVLLNLIATTLLAVTAFAVAYMAWLALADTIQFSATAQTPWATPLKYPQALWLAALVVFVLVALAQVVRVLSLLLTGRGGEVDRGYGPRGAKDELADELADIEARGATPTPAQARAGARP